MENKMILAVLGGLALLVALWGVGTYNSLVSSQVAIDGQWAQVESQYQRRADLIPNLVAVAREYMEYEGSVLAELTALRSQWQTAQSVNEKVEAANGMESALARLLVVMENYPDLKANQNMLSLQDELAGTENRIAVERMRYNDAVRDYNTRIRLFPASMVAGMFGFEKREFFEADVGAETAPDVAGLMS